MRVHDVGGNHGLAVLRASGFGPIKCRCRVSGLEWSGFRVYLPFFEVSGFGSEMTRVSGLSSGFGVRAEYMKLEEMTAFGGSGLGFRVYND